MPHLIPLDLPIRPRPLWPPRLIRCRQRILVVADGALNYNQASDFGLSRLLAELAKITPAPIITTAHRGSGNTGATEKNFRFDQAKTPVTVDNYDQIWLFGFDGVNPAPGYGAEVAVIAEFMNKGGGVFATGDHERLGYTLCGELPRIRKMRDWSSVPMVFERIDTVTSPGLDQDTQFFDQSDEFPQRIFPRYYGSGSSWAPHPLLRSPLGDVDVLPDHPHESVCLTGTDLGDPYALHNLTFEEFPDYQGTPLSPQIIAWSVSAGRYLTDAGKPPTTPRLFGAISVWHGHWVGRGNVVCDATWHHFVNTNLDGTGAPAQPGNNRIGLRAVPPGGGAPQFTVDFHKIAEYYRNIVDWLVPIGRRWCLWWLWLLIERYRDPLIEEWRPLPPHPCPWEPRVRLGTIVESALDTSRGAGTTAELVELALHTAGLAPVAEYLQPTGAGGRQDEPLLIPPSELRRGLVGSIFDAVVADLPANPYEIEHVIGDHDDDRLASVMVGATRQALGSLAEHHEQAARRTAKAIAEWT